MTKVISKTSKPSFQIPPRHLTNRNRNKAAARTFRRRYMHVTCNKMISKNSSRISKRIPKRSSRTFHQRRNHQTKPGSFETNKVKIASPGIHYLLQNRSPLEKKVWALSILVWLLVCFYQIICCSRQFLYGQPNIRVDFEKKQTLPLPQLIVCPRYLFDHRNQIVEPFLNRYKKLFPSNNTENVNFSDLLRLPNITMEDLWNIYGLDANKVTTDILCSTSKNDRSCTPDIVVTTIQTAIGTCTTISPSDDLTIHGPITRLNIHIDTSASVPSDIIIFDFAMAYLVDENEDPMYVDYHGGVSLPSQAGFLVGSKLIQRINKNYYKDPCANSEEVVKCKNKCIEDYLYANAPCRLPFMKPILKDCSTVESFNDSIQVSLKAIQQVKESCRCIRYCQDNIYVVFGDLVEWPVGNVRMIHASCFYLDSNIQVIREFFNYDANDLLTDIGTNLGFFLGLCFLNFCEILEWVFCGILGAFRNYRSTSNLMIIGRKITVHHERKEVKLGSTFSCRPCLGCLSYSLNTSFPKSFCKLSLRSGAIVAAIASGFHTFFLILVSILSVRGYFRLYDVLRKSSIDKETMRTEGIVHLIWALIMMITLSLMVYGLREKKPSAFSPWMVQETLNIVINVTLIISVIFDGILYGVIALIPLAVEMYLFLVVYAYVMELEHHQMELLAIDIHMRLGQGMDAYEGSNELSATANRRQDPYRTALTGDRSGLATDRSPPSRSPVLRSPRTIFVATKTRQNIPHFDEGTIVIEEEPLPQQQLNERQIGDVE